MAKLYSDSFYVHRVIGCAFGKCATACRIVINADKTHEGSSGEVDCPICRNAK